MDIDRLAAYLARDAATTLRCSSESREFAAIVEAAARHVALNLPDRETIVADLRDRLSEQLWTLLSRYWSTLAVAFASSGLDIREQAEGDVISLTLALGKLERNLLAGLQKHQTAAEGHETSIRAILFHITTFSRIEDERYLQLHAVMTQLLSNLISPIDPSVRPIAHEKLEVYLSGRREDDVVSRLLDSADVKTNLATLHLLNNVTKGSQRSQLLLSSSTGVSWLSRLLDKLEAFHDASDGRFELCTQIFTTYIDLELHPRLFGALGSANEPISPSQAVFLKVLDSYISTRGTEADLELNIFLVPVYHVLSAYALLSVKSGRDDARLPKVFEGLHLVCEILCAIGLAVQAQLDSADEDTIHGQAVVDEMKAAEEARGLVKPMISLLKELEVFLPRRNARLSRMSPAAPDIPPDQARPIAQLKRVLVQLLGVLTFGDTAIGDQVREAGGVELVLGMTEVDEGNPYLREHALLVVRNLMLNNPANQAIIGQMNPVGVLGQNGELLPVPERMQRNGA